MSSLMSSGLEPEPRTPMHLPAGANFRFQVASDKLGNGSSWTVETKKSTGDVYVFHREAARWIKASLHESGQLHYSVQKAGRELQPDSPGYIGVLPAPEPGLPSWRLAKRITVAATELRAHWREQLKGHVEPIPYPEGADAIAIDFHLGQAGAVPLTVPEAHLIAIMELGDGGALVLTWAPVDLAGDIIGDAFADEIAQIREDLTQAGHPEACRVVLFGNDDAGFQRDYEIAID